jgi:glycosyltransferase involved in cell wall biosynthesis
MLGIQIANGYSPEARVFAGLLATRADAYQAYVLHHTWASDSESTRLFAAAAEADVTVFDTGWRPGSRGRSIASKIAAHIRFRLVLPRMLEAARRDDPDIIYSCQQHWDCFAATYIARHLNKPQIIHLHYTVGGYLRRPVLERLLTADHVVSVSDFIRQEALAHGVPPQRVTTIRNAIRPFPVPSPGTRETVRGELGVPARAPLIGIVARLDPGKGHDDTISAFAQAAHTNPDAYLVIVGEGTQRQVLEAQVAQTGLGSRILFTGRRSDVPRLLAAFDVFSHPSRNDPCPLALLEASAAGLPVAAYAEGGANEIVRDSVTGLLAAPGSVCGLAECFKQLLADSERARRLGEAGRQRIASEFQPETAGKEFSKLITSIGTAS